MSARTLVGRVARLALMPILAMSLVACGDSPTSQPQPTAVATVTTSMQGGTTEPTVAIAAGTASMAVEQPTSPGSTGLMDLMTIGDPCLLLTEQDVESILGPVEFTTDTSVRTPARLACDYVLPGSAGGTRLSIALESPMNWVAYTRYEGGAYVGGGEDAYAYDENNERKLWVLVRGKAVVNVTLYPTDLDKAKQLADKLIEKLP